MQRTAVIGMAVLVLVACLRAESALAQDRAWDQEQVTELAGQMSEAVKQLRTATRQAPHVIESGSSTRSRATAIYLETLKRLDQATSKLARQLAAGETREQTLGTARRIDSLLRDARRQGSKLPSTEQTDQHLNPALGLVAQLREYYGVAPEPVTETPGEAK